MRHGLDVYLAEQEILEIEHAFGEDGKDHRGLGRRNNGDAHCGPIHSFVDLDFGDGDNCAGKLDLAEDEARELIPDEVSDTKGAESFHPVRKWRVNECRTTTISAENK